MVPAPQIARFDRTIGIRDLLTDLDDPNLGERGKRVGQLPSQCGADLESLCLRTIGNQK
jgi:hypothetical protein